VNKSITFYDTITIKRVLFKMIKKIAIATVIMALIVGCTDKELVKKENQESAFIVIVSDKMKYADMGFIYKSDSFVKAEIYSMGQPLVRFDINSMNICMSTFKCMEKKDFNAKMLSSFYPDTLLENIFRAKAIFGAEGLKKSSNGFTQKIKKEGEYEITYSVKGNDRRFYDKINKIRIKVRAK
jgi:hypothetical protein